ncbi:MAG: hypothetical protein Q4C53_05150 [Clostridia bacterium]|nr:hypothetical protein [Clostridia bacterium]
MEHIKKAAVVVLGMFDGVHRGHRALVAMAKQLADSEGVPCIVYTFANHPAELLGRKVVMLTTNAERERLLKEAGADEVLMEPFTEELRDLDMGDFLKHLEDLFDVRGLACGFNYTFGKFGAGKPADLMAYGKEKGIPVRVLESVDMGGKPVSSTRVRAALADGDTRSAESLLGHHLGE